MGKIDQIVVGIKREKKTVDVATSEEEFNKMTILGFGTYAWDDPSSLRLLYTDKQLEDRYVFRPPN
uniref:Zgc:194655 n=1 Tax=Cyprinus carpio TaxID=7962 RepID=A0A8C1WQ58_CYPCA